MDGVGVGDSDALGVGSAVGLGVGVGRTTGGVGGLGDSRHRLVLLDWIFDLDEIRSPALRHEDPTLYCHWSSLIGAYGVTASCWDQ